MDDQIVRPIMDPFLREGLLGAIIVVQAIVIAYLFRLLMKNHDLRVTELKQEANAHEATTKEMITVVTTNSEVLHEVRSALVALLTRNK